MQNSSGPKAERKAENLGKIGDVDLAQVPSIEECKPGIAEMTEYNILMAPAIMPTKTAGGIILADQTLESLDMAMQMGVMILASPIAFNYDRWANGTPPQVGDILWFARYGGGEVLGNDGRSYRVLKDKDIMAVVRRRADVKQKVSADG